MSAWQFRPPRGRWMRPSAATTSAALSVPPSASSRPTGFPGVDLDDRRRRQPAQSGRRARAAAKSAALRAELAMLAPKLCKPSSAALNSTSGARSRPPRSSTMRTPSSGALCAMQRSQTPRFFSNSTLPGSSAVVRRSASARVGSCAGAAITTSAPDAQRARAAVSPAGPAPISKACVVNSERMRYVLGQSSSLQSVCRHSR